MRKADLGEGIKLAGGGGLIPIPIVTAEGLRLGVNIDHVATLRQARYATMPDSKNAEPDPVAIAGICERAGAHGITAHLRADRRHIQDRDIERLRESVMTKLNLELGNTAEMGRSWASLHAGRMRTSSPCCMFAATA